MIRAVIVAGARPNFIKIAPVIEAMKGLPGVFDHTLVHTGQHYDERMSQAFFDGLGLPKPDIDLGVGSGSHGEQTGRIMIEFEKVLLDMEPDLVIVVGDVNSTMACAITAKKLGIKVAHVEAGLRSRDMEMPEEINRLCTDVLCDFLFTTDELASENLRNEGVNDSEIFFVGNVMIDTLLKHREVAERDGTLGRLGLEKNGYALVTLHRPSNVDDPVVLQALLEVLMDLSRSMPVVFPVHPRTRARIEHAGLDERVGSEKGMIITEPLGYIPFLNLTMNARLVLTDSGGLQEETTVLGVPCLTVRENTERPITCSQGTNRLVGNDAKDLRKAINDVLAKDRVEATIPDRWDGGAARRIVEVLAERMEN